MAETPAEFASRNTPTVWSFKRAMRDIAKIVVVTAILWFLSPNQERASQKLIDGFVALSVAYFVIPFLEWLFNAFRAPSMELQWKNEDVTAQLKIVTSRLDDVEH